MTTPSGIITIAQVNAEIGASPTASITLNDTAVRYLAATDTLSPTSPFLTTASQISMDNLRGRTATIFASGGTLVTTPTHNIHVFTSPGTFTVNYVFPTANTVEYVVVAGGGGGGRSLGSNEGCGGGGAGGFRTGVNFPVGVTSYPVTIGAGGPSHTNGNPSTFSTITSTAGGRGGGSGPSIFSPSPTNAAGQPGGSGGGACCFYSVNSPGSGNTPPTSPPQGNNGGSVSVPGFPSTGLIAGGGGGGSGSAGGAGGATPAQPTTIGGAGGAGTPITWVPSGYGTSSPLGPGRWFGGGGGGGGGGVGGTGGSGGGGSGGGGARVPGNPGTTNTGGGGGGGSYNSPVGTTAAGGSGGSGIVIIRYPIA